MLDYIFDNATPVTGISGNPLGVDKADLESVPVLDQESFIVRVQNLHRLELIVQITSGGVEPTRGFRGWGATGEVGLTALGEAFVKACRGPGRLVHEGAAD